MLCRLPKDTGFPCGRLTPYSAFYFDPDEGKCLSFLFQGCGGNQNRFLNKQECQDGCGALTRCGKGLPLMDFAGNLKRCDGDRIPCPGSHECHGLGMSSVCCIKPERVCHLPVERGSHCGVVADTRFYFDVDTNACRSFSYTGCGGNDNNFKSKGECMQYCSNEVACKRGDPLPDRYSIAKQMICDGRQPCPANYTCTKAVSGNSACCPSKEMVCGQSYDPRERCQRPLDNDLWTFEHKKGRCEKIPHKGCGEQLNSFANMEQCVDFCIGLFTPKKHKRNDNIFGFCPEGLDAHTNAVTGQPQLCERGRPNACPVGYECFQSSPFAAICCRSKPICPAAESILHMGAFGPVRCEARRADSCAPGYTCQQAPNREFVCCTPSLQCPTGMEPLREDGRPRICTPRVTGSCPDEYLCVIGDGPNTIGENKCPSATHCLPVVEMHESMQKANDLTFYCCHTLDVFLCSDGKPPLEDQLTKRPVRCHQSDPMACPKDYYCDQLADMTHACCPLEMAFQMCAEALTNDGEVIHCKGWDDPSCAENAKCRKASNGRYVCCREVSKVFQALAANSPIILF
ncbi:unnamed protein product, partial [Mesorhabditis belari]|uniref:BPTI/Kunitz inhibitor domain-containing protein n=1 Tax=Mesorhabditis belari TaxID=2138241 RepID=A0AAF3E829_9BILA